MATDPTFDGTGLRVLTLFEILDNMRESVRNSPELGPQISTGPYSVIGMLLESVAPELADLYDLQAALYQATDPDSAVGVQLDNLLTIAGLTRQEATRSYGTITLGGTPATLVPAGSIAAVDGGEEVRTLADATIGGGGTVDVAAEAVNTGPLDFGVGSITVVVTSVAGWTSVTNAAEFERGTNRESNSEARARRARDIAAGGSSTDPSLRARLEDLDDVISAQVHSNRSLVTDGYGVPGGQVWAIVHPSTADAEQIALTIWGPTGSPSGVNTYGSQSATITDARGNAQTVYWDWATLVRTYVRAEITKSADYPSGGDALVAQAIVDWGSSALNVAGGSIDPQPIDTYVAQNIPGIRKLTIYLSLTGPPAGVPAENNPLSVGFDEIGDIDLVDVTVVST